MEHFHAECVSSWTDEMRMRQNVVGVANAMRMLHTPDVHDRTLADRSLIPQRGKLLRYHECYSALGRAML